MSWLETARRIKERHQYESVDAITGAPAPEDANGAVLLDATTASMLCAVADALTPANREKFDSMALVRAVDIGWKLVTK